MAFENKTWGDSPDGKFGVFVRFKNSSETYFWYSTKSKRDQRYGQLRRDSKKPNSLIVKVIRAHR